MSIEDGNETRPVVSAATAAPAGRFAFVDGLRGLAALAIVVFHLWWYEPEPYPLLRSVHDLLHTALLRTRCGVQVLLVVSGFVIAYTLRKTWVTPAEVLSFLARRIVRLVPAYWMAIGFALLVDVVCRNVFELPSLGDPRHSVSRVVAHLLFLQEVLGFSTISAGMWTICIEMQFYVVAILGWGLAQRLSTRPGIGHPQPATFALLAVFASTALIALCYWQRLESTEAWVTHYLWKFFLGMVTWWTLDRTVPRWVFVSVVAIGAAHLVFELTLDPEFLWEFEIPSTNAIALVTAVAIFIAGSWDRLHLWLNWPWLQYLSRISYSLYLIHFPVCHLLTVLGWRWCGSAPTPVQATTIFGASLVASLLAAHVLYVCVERPSMAWSARLKLRSNSHSV